MRKTRGEITKISALFEKYKTTLKAPQQTVIECFREVAEDLIGLQIQPKDVKYTVFNRTLSVSVKGPLKSEIKLHEAEILAHLKGRLGEHNAPLHII